MKTQEELIKELQDKYNFFANEIETENTSKKVSVVKVALIIIVLFSIIHVFMNYVPCINVPYCN